MVRTIELDLERNRPVIKIQVDGDIGFVECLVDTGAIVPVWCLGEDRFKRSFNTACKTRFITTIGGFGEGRTVAEVWKIPKIVLVDRNNKNNRLVIKDLLVAIMDKESIGYPFILSYGLFEDTNYSFVNRNFNGVNGLIPYIRIEFDRDINIMPKLAYRSMSDGINDNDDIRRVKRALRTNTLLESIYVHVQQQYRVISCTCVAKIRDKDKYVAYRLRDRKGNERDIPAKELKARILHKEIKVDNLILTKDNRLRGDNIPVIKKQRK